MAEGRSETKRRAIVAAAVAEFLDHGFEAARMDAVAARAAVSKRTLYRHFPGKDALFRAIVEGMIAAIHDARDVRYQPGAPLAAQLAALGWTEGRLLADPGCMATARMVMAEARRDPALAAELDARLDKAGPFRRFFAAAQAAGALRAPCPHTAADQFLALIKAQAFWPAWQSGRVLSPEAIGRVIDDAASLTLAAWAAKDAAPEIGAPEDRPREVGAPALAGPAVEARAVAAPGPDAP